jgi:hypothetical protein
MYDTVQHSIGHGLFTNDIMPPPYVPGASPVRAPHILVEVKTELTSAIAIRILLVIVFPELQQGHPLAIRICISLVAFIVCLEVSAQEKWQKFISGLERRDMSLSISGLGGVSYFQYDTKAIDDRFPTGEATLQILLSKRLNNYFWIETGVRTGRPTSKAIKECAQCSVSGENSQ